MCPSCSKEVVPDRYFCTWCNAYMPNTGAGSRAGLWRRWFATVLDGLIPGILYLIMFLGIAGASSQGSGQGLVGVLGLVFAVLLLAYFVYYLFLLSRGTSPGKKMLGIVVVEKLQGQSASFWRMLLREIIGKWVSGIIVGLGYLWAIWDKDSQAWHDKIAGTVVVRTA